MKQVDSYNKVIFTHNEKPQKKINCLTLALPVRKGVRRRKLI